MLGAGIIVLAVVAAIVTIVGIKIFIDINKQVAVAQPILDVVPTVLAAMAIIGIIMAMGFVGGGK